VGPQWCRPCSHHAQAVELADATSGSDGESVRADPSSEGNSDTVDLENECQQAPALPQSQDPEAAPAVSAGARASRVSVGSSYPRATSVAAVYLVPQGVAAVPQRLSSMQALGRAPDHRGFSPLSPCPADTARPAAAAQGTRAGTPAAGVAGSLPCSLDTTHLRARPPLPGARPSDLPREGGKSAPPRGTSPETVGGPPVGRSPGEADPERRATPPVRTRPLPARRVLRGGSPEAGPERASGPADLSGRSGKDLQRAAPARPGDRKEFWSENAANAPAPDARPLSLTLPLVMMSD